MPSFPFPGNSQYGADVERSMTTMWQGQQEGGVAVFTSAGAPRSRLSAMADVIYAGSVYKEDAGGKVDEGSELARLGVVDECCLE